jgi:apolipoprotein N-acyltransferase
MIHYGDLPPMAPELLLVAFSLYLGIYFGLFGLAVTLVRRATGSARLALAAVPILWIAMELAVSRISGFPWDQLGVSQVDNVLVSQLAPWTGVYGVSFVLMTANALLVGGLLLEQSQQNLIRDRRLWGIMGAVLMVGGVVGIFLPLPQPIAIASAVLVQPNLDVSVDNIWQGAGEWEHHIAEFKRLANEECGSYIVGIPQTGASVRKTACPPLDVHPQLVAWPESPAPFFELEPRFQQSMKQVAAAAGAPLLVGGVGMEYSATDQAYLDYNSALVVGADGARVGRYDKIHLVPFGEYIPFKRLLFFAHALTGRVGESARGSERKVFWLNGHRYGVFICYESVFADEVRQFAQLGAEVLVNLSDDGWYGDTSAPWQHLNMARMRAIENRRWILRDTNSGVTAVIDPYGRVRQSIPRHRAGALIATYGFCNDITFYTAHGDLFGWACALLSFGIVGWSVGKVLRGRVADLNRPSHLRGQC